MKFNLKNTLLAIAAFALASGVGATLALTHGDQAQSVLADGTATAKADVTSGKRYYITATYNDTEYVLKAGGFAAKGSGSYTEELDLTALDESDAWLFTCTDDVWTISATINETTYYLGVTAANNGLTSLESQSYGSWTLTDGTGDNCTVLSAADNKSATRKLALYNGADWRCYTSGSGVQNVVLYEYSAPSKTVTSITVTTSPTVTYNEGDALDLTGMVVTANWSDSTTSNCTADAIYSIADGTLLSAEDTELTISYGGKSTTVDLTVTPTAFGSADLYVTASRLGLDTSYVTGGVYCDYDGDKFFFGKTDVLKKDDAIGLKASTGALYNNSKFTAPISKVYFMADADYSYAPSNWAVYASADTAGSTATAMEITTVDSTNYIYSVDFTGGTYYYFTLAKTGSYATYFDMIVVELVHSDDDVAAVRTAASNMLTVFEDFCSAGAGPTAAQWSTISGYYNALTSDQKAIFDATILNANACNSADSYGAPVQASDLQKAVQKIEYCVSAYGVENFTSREISTAMVSNAFLANDVTVVSMIVLLLVGIAASAGMIILAKKRKRA